MTEDGGERLISAAETDPELARLVSAWPKLSEGIRRAVMALAERTLPKTVEVAMLALLDCGD